jgi:hypothetical protein
MAHRDPGDHDGVPVMVPRSEKRLAPMSPQRIRHLRQHLIDVILDLRKAEAQARTSDIAPEPDGFVRVVARAACRLCKGVCCSHGGDHGYIDIGALTRFRMLHSWLSAEGVVMRYLDRIPQASYRDSCIFHGKKGCTLDRSMRSDICNGYFCGGLRAYLDSGAPPEPTVVIAGETEKMRVSPVLSPATSRNGHTRSSVTG